MKAMSLIQTAIKEIGNCESPKGSNRTKYGEAYGWDGVPWCVQFVWWCFREAGLSSLFCGGKKTASCSAVMRYAKTNGLWVAEDYRPGDLAIFDFTGQRTKTDHIGIVIDIAGDTIHTIEGNTSSSDTGSQSNGDGVYRKLRNKRMITGAYRPIYVPDGQKDCIMTGKEIFEAMSEYLSSVELPDWATKSTELKTAMELGITDGSDMMQMIPRYQAAIMAYRAYKLAKEDRNE